MAGGLFGSPSKSSQSSQYTSTPVDLQYGAYTGLAPGVAGGFGNIFGGGGFGNPGGAFGLNPFMAGGVPTNSGANPLVAGLTPQQMALSQQAYQMAAGGTNPMAGSAVQQMLDPNYAGALAGSPQTQRAITSATNPLVNAFNQTALPGLAGQFTASGQRVNAAQQDRTGGTQIPGAQGYGKGSSAFDKAEANAQNNLLTNVAQTAGGISNSAYQTGLAQHSGAVGQAINIGQADMQNLVSSLQAVALPQLIQQYGINQGVQLFQSQMQTILQALGAAGQISQPAIAYNQQGTGTGTSVGASPGILQTLGNVASGGLGIAKGFGFGAGG